MKTKEPICYQLFQSRIHFHRQIFRKKKREVFKGIVEELT